MRKRPAGSGQRAEARQLLAEIYRWSPESFATLNLWEVEAMLDKLA